MFDFKEMFQAILKQLKHESIKRRRLLVDRELILDNLRKLNLKFNSAFKNTRGFNSRRRRAINCGLYLLSGLRLTFRPENCLNRC